MLEISNNRVILNGKETINVEEIGYALLDYAENLPNNQNVTDFAFLVDRNDVVDRFTKYLSDNAFRNTLERRNLIELLVTMNDFSAKDFVNQAMQLKASYPTCYNFLTVCVDAKILSASPKNYKFINS
jgi:hypothetical protein